MNATFLGRIALWLTLGLSFFADAQTINLNNGVQKFGSLASTTANLSGKCELWVTNTTAVLSGCLINLNSVDAWLFLPGVKPSVVVASYLGQIRVNGASAVADSTVRVAQYGQKGAIVIPQATGFQPLTVFKEPQFGGTATAYGKATYYTGSGIGGFASFKLKRGYQVVLAQSADGLVGSKCYVAQDGDLEVGVLPGNLDRQVQFIFVTPWRWTSKKGVSGDPGLSLLNLLWWYNWNISSSSSRDLEYVAIRQNQYWPGLGQNWQSLGINTVLGYNEPDQANQANMSVGTAISAWGDLLGTGLRVGSPATSDGGRGSWLYPFMQQAEAAGLRVDFVATHYYQGHNPTDPSGAASQMYAYLLDIWNNTHRPIWITEWNNGANWTDNNPWPAPTYAQQQACVSAMVDMLESTPFVERYALYNWVEDSRALTTNGVLTSAGATYRDKLSTLSYSQAMPDNGTRGIAQYLFATNTLDSSGYGNNALAAGAPAYTSGHNSLSTAIALDGANSYLQLPANIARAGGFTFAAWVYWNGGGNWQRIFDFGNDTSHYLYLTPSSGNSTLRFTINNGGGEQNLETGPLTTGTWKHVAVTLNNNVATLYLNGIPALASTAFSITPANFSPIKNYLGKSQFPDPLFNGKLDAVTIADYAMTAAQISTLYSAIPSAFPVYASGSWTNDADGLWSNANNWSGGVIPNGGTGVGYSADFSGLDLTADRTVMLDSNRSLGGLRFGDLSGAQNWTLAGGSTLTLDAGLPFVVVNQNAATISAPLAGSNGFTKSGAGTLILNGANTLTGTINVDGGSSTANDGAVRLASPGALGSTRILQIRNSGNGISSLQLDGTSARLTLAATVSLSGRKTLTPALESLAGTNTLAGPWNLYGSGNYLIQADAGWLNLGGTFSPADTGVDTLTLQGNGNLNLSGVLLDGPGVLSLTKSGTGTLTMGPGSSYSGLTTVNQGTLALQSSPPPLFHLTFDNPIGSGNGSVITNVGLGGAAFNGTLIGSGAAIVGGGRFGNTLSLNGTGGNTASNIVFINSKVLNTDAAGSWTLGYWIKTPTAGAVGLYQGDGGWSSAGQTTYYLTSASATAGTRAGAVRWAGGFLMGSTAALNNNLWHFITIVDSAGTEAIFVDGNLNSVSSTITTPLASNANQLWIGGSPDAGDGAVKMAGLIDEVYLFNRALTQPEVQSLYFNNAITNTPANVLPATNSVMVAAAGTFDLAGSPQTLANLSGNGVVTNSGRASFLTVSNNTKAGLFAGAIGDASSSNALTFRKSGSAVFALSGTNTYSGSTLVTGGTLKLSPVADDSVVHLTFNNPAGSGNGSVITNTGLGGPALNGTIVSTGGAVIQAGGRFGNALSLNGTGGSTANNIVLITNQVLNTDAAGSWTLGYWIKTPTPGAVALYQGDGSWSSAGQTMFYLNSASSTPGGKAGGVRWAGGYLTGTANLNDNTWHFITVVDNGGTELLYVDGNVDAVTSTIYSPLAAGANQVWIGGSPDSGDGAAKMTGMIDEVYLFNRPLSQADVQALYRNNALATNSGNVLPPQTPVSLSPGTTLDVGGVTQTIASLSGSGVVTNSGRATTLAISNASGTAVFSGNLSDASVANSLSLIQAGGSTTILAGANAYRGTTLVTGGNWLVNGSTGTGATTVTNGGLLGGNGTLNGAITVQSGGTLSPGTGIGSLTAKNNVTLQDGSVTLMELDPTAQANDQLFITGTLTYGGSLVVSNLSGPPALGDSFRLFNATATSGNFASNSLPTLNAGLAWNFNRDSGVLSVVPAVATNPTNLSYWFSAGALTLAWPADHTGWRLQAQTNDSGVGLGTHWFDLSGSSLTNTMLFPINTNAGSVFYRLVY